MTKTMELCKVRNGELFTLDGVEFVKLDGDAIASFVLTADTLPESCAFEDEGSEREDHNNFVDSHIQRVVDDWVQKHRVIHRAVVERPIDLTSMDGMTDYGAPYAYGRVLTVDEYRKYRRFIPLADKPYWTASPLCTFRSPFSNASYAYRVRADGSLRSYNVYLANYYCPRPSLYLESSVLVSVEIDGAEKALRDYTDTELLDELLRRRVDK